MSQPGIEWVSFAYGALFALVAEAVLMYLYLVSVCGWAWGQPLCGMR